MVVGCAATAILSVPICAAQETKLQRVEEHEHDENDERQSCSRPEVLPLKGLAIDHLHHRDSRVSWSTLGENEELVEAEQRTSHAKNRREGQGGPEQRQDDIAKRVPVRGAIKRGSFEHVVVNALQADQEDQYVEAGILPDRREGGRQQRVERRAEKLDGAMRHAHCLEGRLDRADLWREKAVGEERCGGEPERDGKQENGA